MSIKVEIKSTDKPEIARSYPYIGLFRSTGVIVLFTAPKTGFALTRSAWYDIGSHHDSWFEADAEIFDGTVTLSND